MTASTGSSPVPAILPYVVAIAFACVAVSVDLRNDEVQAAALVIVVGGFIMGLAWPEHAWRWVLILGLSIAIGDPIAIKLGVVSKWPQQGFNMGAFIALIPAAIGTYAGVGVRASMRAGAGKV